MSAHGQFQLSIDTWILQRQFGRLEVAARGARWLLLRALDEIVSIVKVYSTKLGVVAVFLSSPYWLLVRGQSQVEVAADDVIGFLTKLVLPGLSIWAMGVLMFRILVGYVGPPRSWRKRAVVKGGLLSAAVVGVAGAAGLLGRKLGVLEQTWPARIGPTDPTVARMVVGTVALVGLLWLAAIGAGDALDRALRLSSRTWSLATSLFLLAMSIFTAGFVISGTATSLTRVGMFATVSMASLIGLWRSPAADARLRLLHVLQ